MHDDENSEHYPGPIGHIQRTKVPTAGSGNRTFREGRQGSLALC